MANVFVPLTDAPDPVVSRSQHPVACGKVVSRPDKPGPGQPHRRATARPSPIPTNKFYGNLVLGNQTCAAWTHPYSVTWCKGRGNAQSWGLGISHIERHQMAIGPNKPESGAAQYFLNPLEIYSMILSAQQLGPDTVMTLDSPSAFKANANFAPAEGSPSILTVPLLQGMGFVTGIYHSATPLIQSSIFFRNLDPAGDLNGGQTQKYRTVLEDGTNWLIYVTPAQGQPPVNLQMINNTTIQARDGFSGLVQIAKLPHDAPQEVYDQSAGTYAQSCELSAVTEGSKCSYTFSWAKGGLASNPLLMFALPHHVASFDKPTAGAVRPVYLQSTTKGVAAAVQADSWTMKEDLPVDIGFAPWSPETGSVESLPEEAIGAIVAAARAEIEQDVRGQCILDSMYFSGKGLGKFAMIAYVLHDMVRDKNMTSHCLNKLKEAFDVFVNNGQPNPLAYDETWRGVVSTAGLEGDAGADFGNSWYNDHHFHYGYFVYTAAVISYLDPEWMKQPNRKDWINMLVGDFANPVEDTHYPFHRSFDWFHGHSWAKGLFESADGKDQESTSEDGFASYAVKMWGKMSGDQAMENRGNLMLAIQARSFSNYFLMESNNTVQPPQFIGNKVTGILFENKADHATYFGGNIEYIQGIHMIPANPTSAFTRRKEFVREEWDVYFSNGRVDNVPGGWRGILYANLALIDPVTAYRFFSDPNFKNEWLDGGASRTWYLAYCAALGGLGQSPGPRKELRHTPAQVQESCPPPQGLQEHGRDEQPAGKQGPPITEEQSHKKKLLNRLFKGFK